MIKNLNTIQTTGAGNLIKIADYNTKMGGIKKQHLAIVNILLFKNLIS